MDREGNSLTSKERDTGIRKKMGKEPDNAIHLIMGTVTQCVTNNPRHLNYFTRLLFIIPNFSSRDDNDGVKGFQKVVTTTSWQIRQMYPEDCPKNQYRCHNRPT